jgi:hypothetical protein
MLNDHAQARADAGEPLRAMTSAQDREWRPAGVMSPHECAPVEFELKHVWRIRRGTFVGASYVDAEDRTEYAPKMVKRWRYLLS